MRAYGIYGGVGIQLAVSVLAGAFLGRYLDKKLDSFPLFIIVGTLLGTIAGFLNLYRVLKYQEKNNDADSTKK